MVLHVLRLTQPFNVHSTSEIITQKGLKNVTQASADRGVYSDHTLCSEGLVAFFSFLRFDSLWLWSRQFPLYETSLQGIWFKFLTRNLVCEVGSIIRLSAVAPEMPLLITGRPNINSLNCLLRKSFSPATGVFIVDHFISLWTTLLMALHRLNHFCPCFCSSRFKV